MKRRLILKPSTAKADGCRNWSLTRRSRQTTYHTRVLRILHEVHIKLFHQEH